MSKYVFLDLNLGNTPYKNNVFFRALLKKKGGGGHCPNLFTLFSTMLWEAMPEIKRFFL